MADARVIVGSPDQVDRPLAWAGAGKLLVAVGGLFVVAGVFDIGLAFLPADLGNPGSRFSAAASASAGWPILALGLIAFQLGGAARQSRGVGRAAVGLHWAFGFILAVGIVVLLADRSGVLAGSPPAAVPAVNRAFLRSLIASVSFMLMHFFAARIGGRVQL